MIRWWNLSEERLETIRLPGARVVVEPAPKAAVTEAAAPAKDPRPGWPLAVLAAFGLLAVLALRPLAAWGEARRQRHAASEVGRFDALEAACRRSDPRAALVALYPWIAALRTSPELSTLESLAPAVSVELQQELLAAATEGRDWEGKAFLAALMRVRAQRAGVIAQQASPLAPLNP